MLPASRYSILGQVSEIQGLGDDGLAPKDLCKLLRKAFGVRKRVCPRKALLSAYPPRRAHNCRSRVAQLENEAYQIPITTRRMT